MSVAEMKEELRKLAPEELREIEALVADLRRDGSELSPRVRELKVTDPEFRAASFLHLARKSRLRLWCADRSGAAGRAARVAQAGAGLSGVRE